MDSSVRRPTLGPAVEIRPGTDVEDVWQRFEIFEALHHSMQICNPMTCAQLDEVVEATEPDAGHHVVDMACGYGEVLFRMAAQREINGTGVDLSPWMIASAAAQTPVRAPNGTLQWVLGEARDFYPQHRADIAVCIGAEWVWHDFSGTAKALAARVAPGGAVVIGAARLHTTADADRVRSERGVVETIDDQRELLATHGLVPVHRVDPDDAGWDAYLARTAQAAAAWAVTHPGIRSEQWIEEQADWQAARERDRDVIGWSLWIARASTIVSPDVIAPA